MIGPSFSRARRTVGRRHVDVLLVGGGLANALIAWRLSQVRPDLRLLLVERNGRLGGERTWFCHAASLAPRALGWLEPLIAHRWRSHAVRFPQYTRVLPGGALAITGERLHDWVTSLAGPEAFRFGCIAEEVHARGARVDGLRVDADVVIDGRGWPGARGVDVRYRSFVALDLEFDDPHGLTRPLVMDSTVPQVDGFRFVQALPVGPRRLLLEHAHHGERDACSDAASRGALLDYVAAQGWRIANVVGEHAGTLPIALDGDAARFLGRRDGVARVGLRGAMFHPGSGLTLPDAAQVAAVVAADPLDDGPRLAARLRASSIATWRRRAFIRFLNRLLFGATPDQRHRAMQRIHRLDAALVARFHAADLRYVDRLRLLTGRPRVSLAHALTCLAVRRPA